MNSPLHDFEARLRSTSHGIGSAERQVLDKLNHRLHVARDTNREFCENLSLGDRVADKVASFGGSWTFIFLALALLFVWVLANAYFLLRAGIRPFDPFPFILLNLILSMTAALQAPVIMMSQNRQAAKDRLDAAHDYEVNLKAEMEILSLHAKVDALREEQWRELVALQQQQIQLLQELIEETRNGRPPL